MSLLIYRDLLENQKFASSKFRYDTFQNVNNKGAYQSVQMRRLVCAFVVHKPQRQVFSLPGPFVGIEGSDKLLHPCTGALISEQNLDSWPHRIEMSVYLTLCLLVNPLSNKLWQTEKIQMKSHIMRE